ncbi:MAG TPA: DUF6600 domain-containing protein, partial [Kofleriaceae bacterium]|nr:DUF6600 domain-containing protein [Kofleriaceae bacterium]
MGAAPAPSETPNAATPAPEVVGPEYVNTEALPPGEPVPDETYFYDQLDSYGTWTDDPQYGYVFEPAVADYVPYSNGYWNYANVGWVWVS